MRGVTVRWPAAAALAMLVVLAAGGCERKGEVVASDSQATAAPVNDPVAAPAFATQSRGAPAPDAAPSARTAPDAAPSTRTAPDAAPSTRTAPVPAGPILVELDPPSINFGFIDPNVDVEGSVAISNKGSRPVRIASVKPTCKCTTTNDLVGTVIPAGGAVTLDVTLEGRSVTGLQVAGINIVIEGAIQPYRLDLRAEVTMPVRVNPSILNMAPPRTGEPENTSGHIVVESVDGAPFSILAANGEPPQFIEFDPDLDAPRSSYLLGWDLSKELESGKLPRWWIIETDRPDCPILDAWVRHISTVRRPTQGQPWSINDMRVLLGQARPGDAKIVTLRIKDLGQDEVRTVRSLSGAFDAELVGVQRKGADALCSIRLTTKPGHDGLVLGVIEIIAGAYSQRVDVVGKIAG